VTNAITTTYTQDLAAGMSQVLASATKGRFSGRAPRSTLIKRSA
jgi:hypothetical protein